MTAIVLVILAWNVNSVVKAINPATPEHRKASNLWGDLRDRFENWWIRCAGPLWFHVNILANDFRWGRVATSDREVFRVESNIRGRQPCRTTGRCGRTTGMWKAIGRAASMKPNR